MWWSQSFAGPPEFAPAKTCTMLAFGFFASFQARNPSFYLFDRVW